jgi:hypothetical protein
MRLNIEAAVWEAEALFESRAEENKCAKNGAFKCNQLTFRELQNRCIVFDNRHFKRIVREAAV